MKKILSIIALLMSSIVGLAADFEFTVPSATVKSGHTAIAEFAMSNTINVTNYQFYIKMPSGITLSDFTVEGTRTTNSADVTTHLYDKGGDIYTVQVYTANPAVTYIAPGSGSIFKVTMTCDASVTPGTYTGNIYDMQLSQYVDGSQSTRLDIVGGDFTITVDENMIDLYDIDTTLPEVASYEKAVIHRNFTANVWNTFVAPFAISEAQYKAAFGDDVQVAEFTGQDISDPDTEIILSFTTVTETDANTPVIVKPSAALTEVTFEGTIDVDAEDQPTTQVGKKAKERSYMYGNYVPKVLKSDGGKWEFPLYIKNNKFYYAPEAGVTLKGYRAYFMMSEVLSAYSENFEVKMAIDMDPTAIDTIDAEMENGNVYTIDGKYVGKDVKLSRMQKGVYIVNGKKVINK